MTKTGRKLEADLPARNEVRQLIDACSRRAPTGVRNAALIATAWRCGLRARELCALRLTDLDRVEGRLVVQHGTKGGRHRVVGVDQETLDQLETWLALRDSLGVSADAPLFCTLKGTQLDTSYLRHLFIRLRRRVGIERRIHPHACRHRYAIDLVEDGADIITVQRLLGHSNAAVTSVYLSRVGADGAVAFSRSREW